MALGLGYTVEELQARMSQQEFLLWARYADLFGSPSPSRNIAIYSAKMLTGHFPKTKIYDHLPDGFNPNREIEVDGNNVKMVAGMLGGMGRGVTENLTMARRKKTVRK